MRLYTFYKVFCWTLFLVGVIGTVISFLIFLFSGLSEDVRQVALFFMGLGAIGIFGFFTAAWFGFDDKMRKLQDDKS